MTQPGQRSAEDVLGLMNLARRSLQTEEAQMDLAASPPREEGEEMQVVTELSLMQEATQYFALNTYPTTGVVEPLHLFIETQVTLQRYMCQLTWHLYQSHLRFREDFGVRQFMEMVAPSMLLPRADTPVSPYIQQLRREAVMLLLSTTEEVPLRTML
jgi:hypothetical protein